MVGIKPWVEKFAGSQSIREYIYVHRWNEESAQKEFEDAHAFRGEKYMAVVSRSSHALSGMKRVAWSQPKGEQETTFDCTTCSGTAGKRKVPTDFPSGCAPP